jgi:hypothetical protein
MKFNYARVVSFHMVSGSSSRLTFYTTQFKLLIASSKKESKWIKDWVNTQRWQKVNADPVGKQTSVPQFTDTHVSNSTHSQFLHHSPFGQSSSEKFIKMRNNEMAYIYRTDSWVSLRKLVRFSFSSLILNTFIVQAKEVGKCWQSNCYFLKGIRWSYCPPSPHPHDLTPNPPL